MDDIAGNEVQFLTLIIIFFRCVPLWEPQECVPLTDSLSWDQCVCAMLYLDY